MKERLSQAERAVLDALYYAGPRIRLSDVLRGTDINSAHKALNKLTSEGRIERGITPHLPWRKYNVWAGVPFWQLPATANAQ